MEQSTGAGFTERQQLARNMAQMQLAYESDQAVIPWIEEHAKDFDDLVKRDPLILEELAEEKTHASAIEKVKKEIYH